MGRALSTSPNLSEVQAGVHPGPMAGPTTNLASIGDRLRGLPSDHVLNGWLELTGVLGPTSSLNDVANPECLPELQAALDTGRVEDDIVNGLAELLNLRYRQNLEVLRFQPAGRYGRDLRDMCIRLQRSRLENLRDDLTPAMLTDFVKFASKKHLEAMDDVSWARETALGRSADRRFAHVAIRALFAQASIWQIGSAVDSGRRASYHKALCDGVEELARQIDDDLKKGPLDSNAEDTFEVAVSCLHDELPNELPSDQRVALATSVELLCLTYLVAQPHNVAKLLQWRGMFTSERSRGQIAVGLLEYGYMGEAMTLDLPPQFETLRWAIGPAPRLESNREVIGTARQFGDWREEGVRLESKFRALIAGEPDHATDIRRVIEERAVGITSAALSEVCDTVGGWREENFSVQIIADTARAVIAGLPDITQANFAAAGVMKALAQNGDFDQALSVAEAMYDRLSKDPLAEAPFNAEVKIATLPVDIKVGDYLCGISDILIYASPASRIADGTFYKVLDWVEDHASVVRDDGTHRVIEELDWAHNRLARHAFETGDPTAQSYLDRLIRNNPADKLLGTWGAAIALKQGDVQRARELIERHGVTDLDAVAGYSRGALYLQAEEFSEVALGSGTLGSALDTEIDAVYGRGRPTGNRFGAGDMFGDV